VTVLAQAAQAKAPEIDWAALAPVVALTAGACLVLLLGLARARFVRTRAVPVLALITLGEGWHNNHHFCRSSCRQGVRWWEIDLTWYGLKLLQALGIVWDLRDVPGAARDARTEGVGS